MRSRYSLVCEVRDSAGRGSVSVGCAALILGREDRTRASSSMGVTHG
jgi:hypothetical protein